MSQTAPDNQAFFTTVAQQQQLWSIKDEVGFPAPMTTAGYRSMPFWASAERAEEEIAAVAAFAGFAPVAVDWAQFCAQWVPALTQDGVLAGVNWSASQPVGEDIPASELEARVNAAAQAQ
ncbi:DUF2750 domain-containing protein [Chitinibacter tainanensis]|uniref:DUF2750 domain-containing protein n=1 Tax=Chitinibacter tainanensis TaxID=230667 RepID=UPI00048B445D|nr:DUF2750 domain-containing protein [Chitinibacter tainanensis]